jgi:hypothetical protein
MPSLGAKERAALPNRAFAYIDSQGRRLLPIHDEVHVTWRLSGLRQSMVLLQVRAADLLEDFPPVRPVALARSR